MAFFVLACTPGRFLLGVSTLPVGMILRIETRWYHQVIWSAGTVQRGFILQTNPHLAQVTSSNSHLGRYE